MADEFESIELEVAEEDILYYIVDVISTYVYRTGMVQMQYSFAAAVGLMNSLVNVVLLIGANAMSRKLTNSSLW